MEARTWPSDWNELLRGKDCSMCARSGLEDNGFGKRILHGRFADVYLQRVAFTAGYSIAIWCQGHVAEPTELTGTDAVGYWLEVLQAAHALEQHYSPAKLNYQLLGNAVPHLHAHIIPRYVNDPAPGKPLPFPEDDAVLQDEGSFERQVTALRRIVKSDTGTNGLGVLE